MENNPLTEYKHIHTVGGAVLTRDDTLLTAGFSGDALREDLIKMINTGTLRPGTRISSFRTLANQYNVSLNTVQRVIGELVDAKVLEAAHGRGTFVATAKELLSKSSASVGVFARASGDFFSNIIDLLRDGLVQQGMTPVIYDAHSEKFDLVCSQRLQSMIDGGPNSLVVDGSLGTSPSIGKPYLYLAMKRHAEKVRDLIVINRWDSPERLPATYILFDYFDAGVQIARYLYALGHRSIVLNTYGVPPRAGTSEDDVCNGIHSFFEAQDDTVRIEYFQVPEPNQVDFDEQRFHRLFKAPDHPTAIVAMADYLTEPWFQRLTALGLKVPEDVSLTGFFNTPWVDKLPVPLTSVQLNIEKLVLTTINHILRHKDQPKPPHEEVLVGASLVVRKSTGARTVGFQPSAK